MKKRYYRVRYADHIVLGIADIEKNILAENPEEAARMFYEKYQRDDDCKVKVDWKVFTLSELFPEKKFNNPKLDLICINENFDFDKLDYFAKEVLLKINQLFPDWLHYAKNDEEWETRFNIEWPSPFEGNPDLWVSTASGDYCDLQVGFGYNHLHMFYDHRELKTLESWILKVNEYLTLIKSEELIAVGSYVVWFLKTYSFVTRSKYEELVKNNNLLEAYSWLGTYNYPK